MNKINTPLADYLRPTTLEEMEGQEHLLGKEGFITHIVQSGRPLSILLWGPPGCGKTTLARLYAKSFDAPFMPLSAVSQGTSEFKELVKDIQARPLFAKTPIVFVDEIHRFNKAQQDLFLPYVEKGMIILVGATTENPSFAINNALLSRLRVLSVNHLQVEHLNAIVARYESKFSALNLTQEARQALVTLAQGDARHLLNMIENLQQFPSQEVIDLPKLEKLIQRKTALYDRDQEGHYNLISALHKSIRTSDPNAALYWFARMLEGGEDPKFIARRLIRTASEDIGLADPEALQVALTGWNAFHQLGSPEGELALAQVVIYLALCPKSNASYVAFEEVKQVAKATAHISPPKNVLNAPTQLMQEMEYSKGYLYDHDSPYGCSGQNSLPEELGNPSFYRPVERGFEREMKKRLEFFEKLREMTKK